MASRLAYPGGPTLNHPRNVLPVRENGKMATCLCEAAPGLRSRIYCGGVGRAKVGNVTLPVTS